MKKILALCLMAVICFSAQAQIVSSTSSTKIKVYEGRHGLSYGVSLAGGYGAFMEKDRWVRYTGTVGLYGDIGYNFGPHFYLGASLGVQQRTLNWYDTPSDNVKPVAVRFLINPRVYFLSADSSPFVDLRGGVDVSSPFDKFARLELGLGYLFNFGLEVAAGVDNEFWAPTDGIKEVFKMGGIYFRIGYKFR